MSSNEQTHYTLEIDDILESDDVRVIGGEPRVIIDDDDDDRKCKDEDK